MMKKITLAALLLLLTAFLLSTAAGASNPAYTFRASFDSSSRCYRVQVGDIIGVNYYLDDVCFRSVSWRSDNPSVLSFTEQNGANAKFPAFVCNMAGSANVTYLLEMTDGTWEERTFAFVVTNSPSVPEGQTISGPESLHVGETATYTAENLGEPLRVDWELVETDAASARVSSYNTREVTGRAEGTAVLRCLLRYQDKNSRTPDVTVSAEITVLPAEEGGEEDSFTVSPQCAPLYSGGEQNTLTLTAEGAPEGALIQWSSGNADVASVENGVVTGVGAGSTVITAYYLDESGITSAETPVEVNAFCLISVEAENTASYANGQTIEAGDFTLTGTYSDGSTAPITEFTIDPTTAAAPQTAVTITVPDFTGPVSPNPFLAAVGTSSRYYDFQTPYDTESLCYRATVGDVIAANCHMDSDSLLSVTWESSDPAVISLSDTAALSPKLTCEGAGTAYITYSLRMTDGDIEGRTSKFIVSEGTSVPEGQTISGPDSLEAGETGTYRAENLGSYVRLEWELNGTDAASARIVSVDERDVTGLAEGTAVLSCRLWYLDKTGGEPDAVLEKEITVTPAGEGSGGDSGDFRFEKSVYSIYSAGTNSTASLNLLDVPEGADIQWSSGNPEAATVENGTVTGLSEGSTVVTAYYAGENGIVSAETTVEVNALCLVSVDAVNERSYVGGQMIRQSDFTLTGTYSDGSTAPVTDFSLDPTAAVPPKTEIRITVPDFDGPVNPNPFPVIVAELKPGDLVKSIEITAPAEGASFRVGDSLSAADVEIRITDVNGDVSYKKADSEDVTFALAEAEGGSAYTFTLADGQAGSVTFEVAYAGFSASRTVTLLPVYAVTCTAEPDAKTTYRTGEKLSLEGRTFRVEENGVDITESVQSLTVSDYTFAESDVGTEIGVSVTAEFVTEDGASHSVTVEIGGLTVTESAGYLNYHDILGVELAEEVYPVGYSFTLGDVAKLSLKETRASATPKEIPGTELSRYLNEFRLEVLDAALGEKPENDALLEKENVVVDDSGARSVNLLFTIDKDTAAEGRCDFNVPVSESGTCGDDAFYTIEADGTLNITGSGALWDWSPENPAPWDGNKEALTALALADGITRIGDYAFCGCTGFTDELSLPDSVTEIGDSAFGDCGGFTGGLALPEGLTELGEGAFSGCAGFTGELALPEGLTEIEKEAFAGCAGLTGELSFPDGVTSLGENAFAGCEGLTGTLVLPKHLTSVAEGALSGCTGLERIQFDSPTAELADSAETLPEQAILRGYADSTAQSYAQKYDRVFEVIDDPAAGDVNADGVVSAADLQHFYRYNSVGAPLVFPRAGNLNGDGVIGFADAYILFQRLLGAAESGRTVEVN